MSIRITALISLAALLFLSSCQNQDLALIPKSRLYGYLGNDSYDLPNPSSRVVASASNRPRDKHSMPVYPFREKHRIVRTTAYTCTEDDHIQYGNKSAAGTQLMYTNRYRSAAADWSFYPLGTLFRIKGLPYTYVIDDYGSALTGTGTIDIYKPNKSVMNQWGRRNVEIEVVRWGSFRASAELLSGRTKHAHCRAMLNNIVRQRPELNELAWKR